MQKMTFDEMAAAYLATQQGTRDDLLRRLKWQKDRLLPEGWFLAQCQVLDGSRMGEHVILPYGRDRTFTEPPTAPFSPRGMASDTSVAVGFMPVADLPES